MTFMGRQLSMEATFDERQPLIEDNLGWRPLSKDNFWLNMIANERQRLMEENLHILYLAT